MSAVVHGTKAVNGMTRADEVGQVAPNQRAVWLAGQLDELEGTFVEQLSGLTAELSGVRKLLTGILISIVVGLVSIPVGIIWTAAIARGA